MTLGLGRILFALFFVSGFCSLLYQVVWLRLAFAQFGIVTPVLSTVISVFMLGLALGTFAGGRLVESSLVRNRARALVLYGVAEIVIGVGAFAVPALFIRGGTALLTAGALDSNAYLLRSALWIAGSLLPWCFLMGMTVPFMMAFVRAVDRTFETSFSFLYLANVVGAMCGTAITAGVLVELLGFRGTLVAAAAGNLAIGATALVLSRRYRQSPSAEVAAESAPRAEDSRVAEPGASSTERVSGSDWKTPPTRQRASALDVSALGAGALPIVVLFTTGFTSMAMEVAWTRAFTSVLRTNIYSFAGLLTIYLLATWLGSAVYRRDARTGTSIPTPVLIGLLAAFAFLPILIGDARLLPTRGRPWVFVSAAAALASIFPFCATLGYLTPKLIDHQGRGAPRAAGAAYAVNIVGGILGPLAAGYVLLPWLGVRATLVLLALPFVAFQFFTHLEKGRWNGLHGALAVLSSSAMGFALFGSVSLEEGRWSGPSEIRRDHTATVIAEGEGMDKRMLVNGIPMTFFTPITKNMAHLPLVHCAHTPTDALVICFGAGTTFRSLMSWGVDVTVVELVPSVIDVFPFFFADAEALMREPRANIVVDDGRRFLTRTEKRFDVITLDPPPPIEAAGSSLLHSKEFLDLVRSRLRPGGVLQHWFPGGDARTLASIVKALRASFPHVRVFRSAQAWGFHFLASSEPIERIDAAEAARRMPAAAMADLVEWSPEESAESCMARILEPELDLDALVETAGVPTLTDDRAYNEYFLLRRIRDRLTGQFRFSS